MDAFPPRGDDADADADYDSDTERVELVVDDSARRALLSKHALQAPAAGAGSGAVVRGRPSWPQ